MKKWVPLLWLVSLFLIPVRTAYALEEGDSIEITEEETPQSFGKRQEMIYQGSLILMFALSIGIVGVIAVNYKRPIRLNVTDVKDNGDGSYTVTWGYHNPNFKKVTADKMDLRVKQGVTIILKQMDSKEFYPGVNEEALITVMNQDTSLEWIVNNQTLSVDGKCLIEHTKERK